MKGDAIEPSRPRSNWRLRASVVDGVALAAEGLMFVLLIVVGWRIPDSVWLKLICAATLPLAVGVVWGIALSHNAPRGLPGGWRLGGQITGSLAVGAALYAVGVPWLAVFSVVLIATFVFVSLND